MKIYEIVPDVNHYQSFQYSTTQMPTLFGRATNGSLTTFPKHQPGCRQKSTSLAQN